MRQTLAKKPALGGVANADAAVRETTADAGVANLPADPVAGIALKLLVDGHVNSFIDFFRLSHAIQGPGKGATVQPPTPADEDRSAIDRTVRQLTEQLAVNPAIDPRTGLVVDSSAAETTGGSRESVPSVEADSGENDPQPEPTTTTPALATNAEPTSAELDKDDDDETEATRLLQTSVTMARALQVVSGARYASKPVLPESETDQRAFLDKFDSERTQQLLTLQTLRTLTSMFTQLEDDRRRGDKKAAVEALTQLGMLFRKLELHGSAVQYLSAALDVAKTSQMQHEFTARVNLAAALEGAGLYLPSMEQYEQAHKLAARMQNRLLEQEAATALAHTTLAYCQQHLAHGANAAPPAATTGGPGAAKLQAELSPPVTPARAIALLTDLLAILRMANVDGPIVSDAHYVAGLIENELGNHVAATEHLQEYLDYCKRTGRAGKRGLAQVTLAACYEKQGQPELASQVLQEAMDPASMPLPAEAPAEDTAAETNAADATADSGAGAPEKKSYASELLSQYARAEALAQLGTMKMRQRRYAEALLTLEPCYELVSELCAERLRVLGDGGAAAATRWTALCPLADADSVAAARSVWQPLQPFDVQSIGCQLGVSRAYAQMGALQSLVVAAGPAAPSDEQLFAAFEQDTADYRAALAQSAMLGYRAPAFSAPRVTKVVQGDHARPSGPVSRDALSDLVAWKSFQRSSLGRGLVS